MGVRILVTGSSGMLGTDLVTVLKKKYQVIGLANRKSRVHDIEFYLADLADQKAVLKIIMEIKPQIIIHAAAIADAEVCEENPDQAFKVNTKGSRLIGMAAEKLGAGLIFISSDYVFDGEKTTSYAETDRPNPQNVYGQTKVQAEEFLKALKTKVFIVRPCWLFGAYGPNFFKAILKKIARNENLKVVNDQRGAPTYTVDLAHVLEQMITKDLVHRRETGYEIYHVANSRYTTWYNAADWLVKRVARDVNLRPITSEELGWKAKRPSNSIYDLSKIKRDFNLQLRSWDDALCEYWDSSLKYEWEKLCGLQQAKKQKSLS